jgi:hypothetical protein
MLHAAADGKLPRITAVLHVEAFHALCQHPDLVTKVSKSSSLPVCAWWLTGVLCMLIRLTFVAQKVKHCKVVRISTIFFSICTSYTCLQWHGAVCLCSIGQAGTEPVHGGSWIYVPTLS